MPQNLLMSEDEWARLPELLEDELFARVHANNEKAVTVITEAGRENFRAMPGDLREGTTTRNNPWLWRVFKHRLFRFAVSWRLTGAEASRREALRTVDELIDPEEWCTVPDFGLAHGDLRTADLWVVASFALEALAPALSRHQEAELLRLLTEWALPAYLKGIEAGEWWRRADFNWGSALHGAAGMAALTVQPEVPDQAARVLAEVREGLRPVIANFPEGGGWTEGLMYMATTLGHLTDFVAALHRLTGDDLGLGANGCLHAMLDSRPWLLGGDREPINFSNLNQQTEEWRLPHAWWWADHCGRPDWAGFEAEFPRPWYETNGVFLEVELFWFRKPGQPTEPFHEPRGLWHGRELDWLSWKEGDGWLAFRSGYNAGNHNNRDLGQIVFGLGEERVLCDPGYGAEKTSQHSCLTFRGYEQTIGAEAKIFRAETYHGADREWLYLCCDLSAAYPGVLLYHHRHVVVNSAGQFFLFDDALARRGLRLGVTGHLQFDRRLDGEGTEWTLRDSPHGYRLRFLSPVHPVGAEDREWKGRAVTTLAYRSLRDAPAARLGLFLAPAGRAHPEWVDHGNVLEIHYETTVARIDTDECRLILQPC